MDGWEELEVLDVRDPHNPVRVGGCETITASAEDLAVVEDHAYLATDAGVEVIDISNPTNPVPLSVYETGIGRTFGVSIDGAYAYVADYLSGLHVLDISDPEHPRRVGGNSASMAAGVALHGKRVYVAARWDGLIILNQFKPLRVMPGPRGPEIHWDRGTLQFTPTVNASWTDLPAASPFPLSPIGEKGFFRVKVEE